MENMGFLNYMFIISDNIPFSYGNIYIRKNEKNKKVKKILLIV